MLQNTKQKIQTEIKESKPFFKNMIIFFTIAYLLLSLNPPTASLNQPSPKIAQASEFIQTAEIEPLSTRLSFSRRQENGQPNVKNSDSQTEIAVVETKKADISALPQDFSNVKSSDRDRVLEFLKKRNPENAEVMATACLENMSFDVCRLSLAIAVKESKVGNHFKIASSWKWVDKNASQVSQVVEASDNAYAIKHNLWGVKSSSKRGVGGNFQPLIDLASKTSYTGSVIGYKSYNDAFSDHNRILTSVYSEFTKGEISKDDISGISQRYLTGNKKAWTDTVYTTFKQI